MIANHRYTLDKGSKKFICPECNQKKFVRYIDILTNEYLPDDIGKCERKYSCGCWNKPIIATAEKQPVNYYFVPFNELINHSNKAYKINTDKGLFYLPMSTVYEVGENGCYVAEWFLKEGSTSKKPLYLSYDFKSILEGEAVPPAKQTDKPATAPKPISFIDPDLFKASLRNYEGNHFVQYLIKLFGNDVAGQLVAKYYIGSSKRWPGANIFWQIDIDNKLRTGKIMLYSPVTGKRITKPYNHFAWVHSAIKQPDYELSQCLYGYFLLKDKTKWVALFESEKTAIIASLYYPQFNCVAAGGADGLSIAKCEALNRHGKPVVLFPDLSAPKEGKQSTFEKWQQIASKHLLKYTFSTLLESKASEADKAKGLDLADYLIQFDYREFREQSKPAKEILVNNTRYKIDGHITHLSECKTVFEGMVIVKMVMKTGEVIKILYSVDEDAPPLRSPTEFVKQLESHYNLQFIPAIFEGIECLASIVKPIEAKAKSYSIEQLTSLAISHFNKYPMFKNKAVALPNYFAAWVKDMGELIMAAGTTEQELLNILVCR